MKFLLSSDLHIRLDRPIHRVDDFVEIQGKTLEKIRNVALKHRAILLISGDLLDKARPVKPQQTEIIAYNYFSEIKTFLTPGNHDLIDHNTGNIDSGSIGVITRFNNINMINNQTLEFDEYTITGVPYDVSIEPIKNKRLNKGKTNILMLHDYCDVKRLPEFIESGFTAEEILNETEYDLIVVGHHHKSFVYERNGRFVVNPGCITRQSISEADYEPKVYLYDSDKKTVVKAISLPDIEGDVFDLSAIQEKKRIDEIKNSFVDKLSSGINIELSLSENIEEYVKKNKVNKRIGEILNTWTKT